VIRRVTAGSVLAKIPTGGDCPTPTTDRRSLLSFVAAFALVFVFQI